MSIKITLECDGCFVETGPYLLPRREFNSFNGKGYGFGTYTNPTIDDIKFPDGWVTSDPYTGCVYCPECWAVIIEPKEADDMAQRCDVVAEKLRDDI